jgi:hypothetical protein
MTYTLYQFFKYFLSAQIKIAIPLYRIKNPFGNISVHLADQKKSWKEIPKNCIKIKNWIEQKNKYVLRYV